MDWDGSEVGCVRVGYGDGLGWNGVRWNGIGVKWGWVEMGWCGIGMGRVRMIWQQDIPSHSGPPRQTIHGEGSPIRNGEPPAW